MAKIIKIYKNGIEYKLGGGTASNPNQVPDGYVQLMGCNAGIEYRNLNIANNISIYSNVNVLDNQWGINVDYNEEDKIDFLYSDVDDFNTFYIYVKTEDVDRIRYINCNFNITRFYQNVKLKTLYRVGQYLTGFDNVDLSEFVLTSNAFCKTVDNYKHIEDIVVGSETTTLNNVFGMFNVYNSDYSTIYDLDLSKWDVSNITNMNNMFYGMGTNNGNTRFNLDLSTWDTSGVTNMRYMFCKSNIRTLRIDNFDMSNVQEYSQMFTTTNLTNIYCKQAFRDWCVENKDEIGFSDYFINSMVGSYKYPDLYTWCIVDWTGTEPVLKNLFNVSTLSDLIYINAYNNNNNAIRYYEGKELNVTMYDIQEEQVDYFQINGNSYGIVVSNTDEVSNKFKITDISGIDASNANIKVTGSNGSNNYVFYYCNNGTAGDWDLSGFTFEYTRLFYNCSMKSLKLPQSLGEFSCSNISVQNYVICSSAALYTCFNSIGTQWVGPLDSNCYYRLYDYDENESYNGYNINLKDPNEWDNNKFITFETYDKNGMKIPTDAPMYVEFMYQYTDANGNEQQNGWYSCSPNGSSNVYGYGTVQIIINNYVNHIVLGQLNLKGDKPTFTLNSSSPVKGNIFRIDLDWEYVEYTLKEVYIKINPFDEDGNAIDASLLNKLNIYGYVNSMGSWNFNETNSTSTYEDSISFQYGAYNQHTGQTSELQNYESELAAQNNIELNVTVPASWIDVTEKVVCKIFGDGQVLLYDGSNQRTVDLSPEGTEITGSLVAPVGIWKFYNTTRLENVEVYESNMFNVVASQDEVLNGMFENCPDLEYVYIGFSSPMQGYYARNAFNGKSKLKVCDCGTDISFNGYYKNNMFLDTVLQTIKCGYNAFSDFIQGQNDESMMPWAEGSKTKYFAGPIGSGANYELYDWESYKNIIPEENWYTNMIDLDTFECTDISLNSNEVTVSASKTSLNVNVICSGTVQKINSTERIDYTKTEVVTVEFEANTTEEERSFLKDVTIYGKTVQILITQRAVGAAGWDIDLMDGEFRVAETGTNPDATKFDMYESCGHTGQDNTQDQMNITISGYDTFRVYVKNYSEQNFDYIRVRGNDGSEIWSGQSVSDYNNDDWNMWKEIVVDCAGENYTLKFEYIKDSSNSINNDRGYVLVPKDQSYKLENVEPELPTFVENANLSIVNEFISRNNLSDSVINWYACGYGVYNTRFTTAEYRGTIPDGAVEAIFATTNNNHYVQGDYSDNVYESRKICGAENGASNGTNLRGDEFDLFDVTAGASFKVICYKEDYFQSTNENVVIIFLNTKIQSGNT